jgi:hypothetical protein
MWRPRSDIGKLEVQDLEFSAHGLTLTSKMPKGGTFKKSRLARLDPKQEEICPTAITEYFLLCSQDIREVYQIKSLFIAFIEEETAREASEKTVVSWLLKVLKKAGIDTSVHKAHRFRSASATKAFMKGNSVEQIKLHANGAVSSDTLERFYLKPYNQHQQGSRLLQSILPDTDTEKNTTSEVVAEATTIVVGTTHNGFVAGERPMMWYGPTHSSHP